MDGSKISFGVTGVVLWVTLVFLCVTLSVAQLPFRDRTNSTSPRSHPWLATAPGEYLRLINRGNVGIKVDDALLASHRKAALTQFEIKLDYKCIYSTPRGTAQDIGRQSPRASTTLDFRYTRRDLKVAHSIIIPNSFQPDEPWKDRLLKHEMDHVAITTDPRLYTVVQGIFSRGATFVIPLDGGRVPSSIELQGYIDQFTAARISELESLLQYQYDELDRVSRDGLEDLEDRLTFFQNLYDYEACRKRLTLCLDNVSRETWERWTRLESKKLSAHYSLSR
ncbi:hypothetical protein SH449x_005350 [Pirellulaceae bacterium SH449]